MKILIVEDDRNLSHAIKRCLPLPYDSDQAFDGAEGYFLASKGIYDLIILDLMLPALDGCTAVSYTHLSAMIFLDSSSGA